MTQQITDNQILLMIALARESGRISVSDLFDNPLERALTNVWDEHQQEVDVANACDKARDHLIGLTVRDVRAELDANPGLRGSEAKKIESAIGLALGNCLSDRWLVIVEIEGVE